MKFSISVFFLLDVFGTLVSNSTKTNGKSVRRRSDAAVIRGTAKHYDVHGKHIYYPINIDKSLPALKISMELLTVLIKEEKTRLSKTWTERD